VGLLGAKTVIWKSKPYYIVNNANQGLKKVFFNINGLEIFAIIIWQYGIYTKNAQFLRVTPLRGLKIFVYILIL
jgi:hypothetical protein